MGNDNIFNRVPDLNYHEPAPTAQAESFRQMIQTRRSIRVYDETPIPEEVMQEVLEWSLLAPNSSNLQCWEIQWIRDDKKRAKLAELCFNQPAARTAPELVVFVARPKLWRAHARQMIAEFKRQESTGQLVPKSAWEYYRKIVPFVYAQGPFGLFGLIKKPLIFVMGLFQLVPRQPTSWEQLKKWASKSTALACQNFMMGMNAHGFDTCPMEGFDESRVKKLLGLKYRDEVVMIISAGRRAPKGVYGPRIRFPKEQFIKQVF